MSCSPSIRSTRSKRICAERDIELDRKRCVDMLTPYIDLFRCKDFVREVFFISLHEMERPLKRVGGLLDPKSRN